MKIKVDSIIAKDLRPEMVDYWNDLDTTTLEGIVSYYYCRDIDAVEAWNIQTYQKMGLDNWSEMQHPEIFKSHKYRGNN